MASKLFAGKLALVTGGGSGIGRAVCRVLARDGAKVIAADMNIASANKTLEMLINPSDHMAVEMNIAESSSVKSAWEKAMEVYSSPPSLVANAAGITKDNWLLRMDEKEFTDVVDVNLKGTFLVTQTAAYAMADAGIDNGAIVNISSVVAKSGNLGQCNYSASKAAVECFSKTAAQELGKMGVRINVVLPGFIDTPMVKTVPEKVQNMLLQMTPLGRLGEPEEVAEVVAFLLSDKSSFMTGACVDVTGGLNMS